MNLGNEIVRIAKSYIGQQEIRGNLGFKNPDFHVKMLEVGFKRGHAWCAYFTELVYKEAFLLWVPNSFDFLDTLFSASTQLTWNNFRRSGPDYGFEISDIPQPGALAVWRSKKHPTQGHIAICETGVIPGPRFKTVEGNTNDKGGREGYIVAPKTRKHDFAKRYSLNLLGFVYYPLELIPVEPDVVIEPQIDTTNYIDKYLDFNIYNTQPTEEKRKYYY